MIVALILLLAWAARRFSGLTQLGGQDMKVLGALPLSHRERAVLVQVGDKQMLLGVAPGNVSMLHVFEPGELQRSEFNASKEGESGFRSVLQQALNRKQ